MPTRKEQAMLTKKRIMEVTEELIKEVGYDSIRIIDIARACKMSSGNFYHYFSSLQDLFEKIDDVKFYESFRSLKPQSRLGVVERIESYFYDWINLTLSHYDSQYMYYWTRRYTTTSCSSQNRIKIIVGHISHILQDGIHCGELSEDTPVELFAHTIAFVLLGSSAYFGVTSDEDLIRSWQKYFGETYVKKALLPYIKERE